MIFLKFKCLLIWSKAQQISHLFQHWSTLWQVTKTLKFCSYKAVLQLKKESGSKNERNTKNCKNLNLRNLPLIHYNHIKLYIFWKYNWKSIWKKKLWLLQKILKFFWGIENWPKWKILYLPRNWHLRNHCATTENFQNLIALQVECLGFTVKKWVTWKWNCLWVKWP